MNPDEYLNVDADGTNGTGPAVAAVLQSVADALDEAPDSKRYDFELIVEERTVTNGEEVRQEGDR